MPSLSRSRSYWRKPPSLRLYRVLSTRNVVTGFPLVLSRAPFLPTPCGYTLFSSVQFLYDFGAGAADAGTDAISNFFRRTFKSTPPGRSPQPRIGKGQENANPRIRCFRSGSGAVIRALVQLVEVLGHHRLAALP